MPGAASNDRFIPSTPSVERKDEEFVFLVWRTGSSEFDHNPVLVGCYREEAKAQANRADAQARGDRRNFRIEQRVVE